MITDRCRHFRGIQHDTCLAGVEMNSMRDVSQPGMATWPCQTMRGRKCPKVCDKFSVMTAEDIAAKEKQIRSLIDEFNARLAAGGCPHCGKPAEPTRQVGRCLYAACGHRIGQRPRSKPADGAGDVEEGVSIRGRWFELSCATSLLGICIAMRPGIDSETEVEGG